MATFKCFLCEEPWFGEDTSRVYLWQAQNLGYVVILCHRCLPDVGGGLDEAAVEQERVVKERVVAKLETALLARGNVQGWPDPPQPG